MQSNIQQGDAAPGEALPIGAIIDAVMATHPGLVVATNWGEQGLFYNPGGMYRLNRP